ncbi:hypothetical protein GCWU000324_00845 [Kingella oralis ATCC 51147]|uniref:Uncharacterized protein n=1 Tax=Kingella oralis ATCC 51147 TaxID=629741 RepID=C4GFC9_9NEIS|nr:hypothetical protein GCWU000324_00845 [Kingella oralis ATCC 51147]
MGDKGSLKTAKTAFQAAYLFKKDCSQNIVHKTVYKKQTARNLTLLV